MMRVALPSSLSHCWHTVQVRMALPLSLLRDVTKGTLTMPGWERRHVSIHTLASSMFPLETVEELGDLRQGWNDSFPFPHLQLNKVFLGLWEGWISVDCLLLSRCKQSTIITTTMVKLSICSFFTETASLQWPGSRFSRQEGPPQSIWAGIQRLSWPSLVLSSTSEVNPQKQNK